MLSSKACNHCGETKPLSEFNRQSNKTDGHRNTCRPCSKQANRDLYQENRDRYYETAVRYRDELLRRVRDLKDVPCADCGLRFDPVCMDFDHLPGQPKVKSIARMVQSRVAWEKIEAEIAKCEVVCSNCHRLRTRDRLEVV